MGAEGPIVMWAMLLFVSGIGIIDDLTNPPQAPQLWRGPCGILHQKARHFEWNVECLRPTTVNVKCGGCAPITSAEHATWHYNYLERKTDDFVVFSAQEFLDCTKRGVDCKTGGSPALCYEYALTKPGLFTADEYPYEDRDGGCREAGKTRVTDHPLVKSVKLKSSDRGIIISNLQQGPVSAQLDFTELNNHPPPAAPVLWNGPCDPRLTKMNHAVLIIGWRIFTVGNRDVLAWIIYNNHGDNWGHLGRAYLSTEDGDNKCGLLNTPYCIQLGGDPAGGPCVSREPSDVAEPEQLDALYNTSLTVESSSSLEVPIQNFNASEFH